MKNAIIQILLFLVFPIVAKAQIESTEWIINKAIQKRNESKILNAEVEFGIRSIGDLFLSKMDYKIYKILNDSFCIKREKIGGGFRTYTLEFADSLTHISLDKTNSTFTYDQHKRNPITRNIGLNSRVIKNILGQYVDSSLFNSVGLEPNDTIIFGIPCWELIQKPFNTPVSEVIESSYFISKADYVIRGYHKIETYTNSDTVYNYSFIKQLNYDILEARENIKKLNLEIEEIKRKFAQTPTVTFNLNPKLFTGVISTINTYSIQNQDSITLDFRKGRYLLDFWFIGCYPCMKSFPYLDSLENKYKPKGVHFIKLNPLDAKDPEKVIKYSNFHSIDKENFLISRNLCSSFSVDAYPSFIFIEDGKIIKSYTGFEESVYEELKKYLEIWTAK